MSRRSDDAPMTITEKMNVRALKSAGLETVPQQSNMSEWLAFRKCLVVQEDRHAGWEDIFSTVLASSTILASGNRIEDLELSAGLMQCYTAQSMPTDSLTGVPWAKELRHLSELEQESLWDLKLPKEYVPGTSRPAVDVVPTIYVVTSDSTLALITGKGKTLKKYTLKEDLALRKADMILEIGHDMLWGKLCKANIAMTKDLMSKFSNYGSAIRIISVIFWSGNEVSGEYGVEPRATGSTGRLASDAFNAVEIYASSGAAAIQRMNAKGKKITTADKCPGVIYHRTTKGNWKGILRDGFVAGGGEPVSSGRAHSYFSEVQVSDKKYVSGLRAGRPIEIRVAMSEAVRSGAIFFKTSSDGILTSDVVPSLFIISVDDTEKKTSFYRRHEDTAQSAHGSGGEVGVQELVKSYEAKSSQRTGSTSPAASTGAPAAPLVFPGKVKPPPPNVAQTSGMPGYAHSRLLPPPSKR